MTYNYHFDDRRCYYDVIIDRKIYNINQNNQVKIRIEDIV